jgi:hypothetical protein
MADTFLEVINTFIKLPLSQNMFVRQYFWTFLEVINTFIKHPLSQNMFVRQYFWNLRKLPYVCPLLCAMSFF